MADNAFQQSSGTDKPPEFTELEWITLKNDINSASLLVEEPSADKFMRKLKENPFVPIGCGLTATALCFGFNSFIKGQSRLSQKMMRMRVAAQGFTVAALIIAMLKSTMN